MTHPPKSNALLKAATIFAKTPSVNNIILYKKIFLSRGCIKHKSLKEKIPHYARNDHSFLSLRATKGSVAVSPLPIWGGKKTLLNTPPKRH